MTTMVLKDKDRDAQKMVEDHHNLANEIAGYFRSIAEDGEKCIALFVKEIGADGKTHTRRL